MIFESAAQKLKTIGVCSSIKTPAQVQLSWFNKNTSWCFVSNYPEMCQLRAGWRDGRWNLEGTATPVVSLSGIVGKRDCSISSSDEFVQNSPASVLSGPSWLLDPAGNVCAQCQAPAVLCWSVHPGTRGQVGVGQWLCAPTFPVFTGESTSWGWKHKLLHEQGGSLLVFFSGETRWFWQRWGFFVDNNGSTQRLLLPESRWRMQRSPFLLFLWKLVPEVGAREKQNKN